MADVMTSRAIDDVFRQDISDFDDDPFADERLSRPQDQRDDKPILSPRPVKRKADVLEEKENFGLGLDAEVQVKKKRQPIAKLDEARLLSQPGIPKLRAQLRSDGKITSAQMFKKLRLKGKGHEFTDVARLLNYYQLWLDNLYPRAKFADALQLVEKAGHSKRMQITRNEWINEGKPGYRYNDLASEEARPGPQAQQSNSGPISTTEAPDRGGSNLDEAELDESLFIPDDNDRGPSGQDTDDHPEDDDLDALMAMQDDLARNISPQKRRVEESEGEDDLDALLAEQESRAKISKARDQEAAVDAEDDLDALLAEQAVRQANTLPDWSNDAFEDTYAAQDQSENLRTDVEDPFDITHTRHTEHTTQQEHGSAPTANADTEPTEPADHSGDVARADGDEETAAHVETTRMSLNGTMQDVLEENFMPSSQ